MDLQSSSVAIAYHYRAILIDAFNQLQQMGGTAVIVDAVIEIARHHGYPGTSYTAVTLLELED